MSVEGLRAILNKDEIVPTRPARDFIALPQDVDDTYKHHVRAYVPLQTGLADDQASVATFAARFIRQVKEARAPRGYITADFGYGKTSAGLYVWQQASEARLAVLPPFRLSHLEDFFDATYGWVSYLLGKTAPALVDEAAAQYRFYRERTVQAIAARYGMDVAQAARMMEEGALLLHVTPAEVVRFFTSMTQLVQKAGFEGLVVIADEVQQYLEPEIKSGRRDPLAPLFDIVTELLNLQGRLAFGLLLIITSKELGVINDQRADLVDRLRGNTLDLRAIYDRAFPARLWARLAEALGFADLSSALVDPNTLVSLGEIAARQDLSNGPRTVINAFRRMAQRFLDTGGQAPPYTPGDLVDDFLANRIAFDGVKQIQEVTARALQAGFVRGDEALEQAVRLAAAFPQEGVKEALQHHYHLAPAFAELKASGFPEIVVEVGDRHQPGMTLRGLDREQTNSDELTLILRDFARHYDPQAEIQIQRAVNAFLDLLRLVFKPEHWNFSREPQGRDLLQNAEVVYEGAFADTEREFPGRYVHVRVLGDDESAIETGLSGECRLTFLLNRFFDKPQSERAGILGHIQADVETYHAVFTLNLMLPCFDALSRAIQDQLRQVVDAEQVTPLMVLALHAYLGDVSRRNQVSKAMAQMIDTSLRRRLLEGALEVLLNPAVGVALNVAGERIVEETVETLIRARFGDRYRTLMTYKHWRDALRSYMGGLKSLHSFAQKQGLTPVRGTKDDIARLFSMAVASFDNFQSRIPDFLHVVDRGFPTRAEARAGRVGGVLFTRHPLEETILASLEQASDLVKRDGQNLRALRLEDVRGGAEEMGYRPDEVRFALDIMAARDLVELTGPWVVEKPRPVVAPEALARQVQAFARDAGALHHAFNQEDTAVLVQRARQYAERVQALQKQPQEAEGIRLTEEVESDARLLKAMVARRMEETRRRIHQLQIPRLPEDWLAALTTPIRGAAYTGAVNQVRVTGDQECRQWNDEAATLREHVLELQKTAEGLSIESLQRTTGRLHQLEAQAAGLGARYQHLERLVQQTRAWAQVANRQMALLDDIQRLGEPARDFLLRLQEVERAIEEAFAARGAETFASAPHYQAQMDRLGNEVDGFTEQAEHRFNREQENCRSLLIRTGGIRPDDLWAKIVYSPRNPAAVYNNLYEMVQSSVADILDSLYSDMEKAQHLLIGLRILPVEQELALPDERAARLVAHEAELAQLDARYSVISSLNTTENAHVLSQFEHLLNEIVKFRHDLAGIQERLQALRHGPESPPLLPDEERVWNVLQQLHVRPNDFVDFVRLLQALHGMDDEAFWLALQGLWQKQRIRIGISSEARFPSET